MNLKGVSDDRLQVNQNLFCQNFGMLSKRRRIRGLVDWLKTINKKI